MAVIKHKETFTLNTKTYYSPERPHISNSMLTTYKRSPSLYKRRYIDRDPEAQMVRTRAMILGSIVDDLVTRRGRTDYTVNPFDYNSERKLYLEFKNSYIGDKVVDQGLMDEAKTLAKHIKAQPFYKSDKKTFQKVLTGELEGTPICGLADWITDDKLVDLKVVGKDSVLPPHRWNRYAWDMGYYRQFALYNYMLPKPLTPHWAIAHNAKYGVTKIYLYKANERLLNEAFEEARELIKQIKRKRFKEPKHSWSDVFDLNYVD